MMTTDWPEVTILDVGHGSCTVLRDGDSVLVVDVPARPRELLETLREYGLNKINTIVISHGDQDHIAGLPDVLLDEELGVERVFLNPDADRSTATWQAVRLAVREARRRGLDVRLDLTCGASRGLSMPRVEVAVVAPAEENAMSGVTGRTLEGRRMTANSMSAVLHLFSATTSGVLIAGDIDDVALEAIRADNGLPKSEVLIFPHHGGRPGSADPEKFAAEVAESVQPSCVVFSLARDQPSMPRPEIVDAISEAAPDAHVACTQLALRCAAAIPLADQLHLLPLPARGYGQRACCAGSLRFVFTDDGLAGPGLEGHRRWVQANVAEAVCRRMPDIAFG